mmetsp:Transcript_56568/g.109193  ORF Transcript_56568/g.109193 Transcript_56568/m.109193 type:complete len:102 (-) Transcript_56568:1888-2193(-)
MRPHEPRWALQCLLQAALLGSQSRLAEATPEEPMPCLDQYVGTRQPGAVAKLAVAIAAVPLQVMQRQLHPLASVVPKLRPSRLPLLQWLLLPLLLLLLLLA